MDFRYSIKHQRIQLGLSILYTLLALSFLIEGGRPKLINYLMFFLAVLYWTPYLSTRKKFVTMSLSEVKVFTLPRKKISFSTITNIKIIAGKVHFIGNQKTLIINKNLIHKDDVQKFEDFLNAPENGLKDKLLKEA